MAEPFVTIAVPSVNHKGPNDTEAAIFIRVAENLDRGYLISNGHVSAAVSALLRRTAAALEADHPFDEYGECVACRTPWQHHPLGEED